MKKILLISPIIALLVLAGCNVEEVDSNVAEKIVGTYSFDTYETQSGPSTGDLSNNKVVVTRVDDTHAKIVIDYADADADDVEASNAFIEESGSSYNFSQTFSNATLEGTITGDNMTYELNYTNENFVKLTASK